MIYGYEDRLTGHLLFFTSTWLTLGCPSTPSTRPCGVSAWAPPGLSGMTCPCPRSFWAATCLMHHPLWFALILPMNAMLADLPSYHVLVGAMVFARACNFFFGAPAPRTEPSHARHCLSGALTHRACARPDSGARVRRAGQEDAGRDQGRARPARGLRCGRRGALFFPLCIDIAGHLFEGPVGGRAARRSSAPPS